MELNSTNQDFEKVVAESKGKIQEEMISKQPKKRGRPSKNHSTTQGSSPVQPNQTNSTQPTGIQGPSNFPDISNQMKIPIQVASRIPAIRYQIAELAFDDSEALAVSQAVNEVLKAFIPDVEKMSPKTAAILSCSLVLGSISFNKYMIYTDVMTARRALNKQQKPENTENKVENQSNETGPVLNKDSINANQLFRKG